MDPALVAAIAAALAAYRGDAPGRLTVRAVRPLAAGAAPAPAWPSPWAWAGRRDLMADRSGLLWRRR